MEVPTKKARKSFKCEKCDVCFDRLARLKKHQGNSKKCSHCAGTFCNEDILQRHLRTITTPAQEIEDIHQKIQPKTLFNSDAGLQAVLLGKLSEVSDWEKEGKNYKIINKAINHNFTYDDLFKWLKRIYENHSSGFKLAIGFGFILYHHIQKKYKYYYVSENNMLFDRAYTIDSKKDLDSFMKRIVAVDLPTNCYLSKPSSGWVLSSITNVRLKITDLVKTLLGSGDLPSYIKNLKSIKGLAHSEKTGEKYTDNLCFFRCLAVHHGLPLSGLERYTKTLYEKFVEYRGKNFEQGISIIDLPFIELCFNCPVNVYSLKESGAVEVEYISPLDLSSTEKIMYLNLYEKHFSYISDIGKYGKKYKCPECDRIFDRNNNFNRHVKICKPGIREVYLGGKFDAHHDSIFDKLEKIGISVKESDRYYKFVSVFDYEAIQVPDPHKVHGMDILYTHIPATFSVCSNVPGFEDPVHIQSDGRPQLLVDKMVELQLQHQEKASQIMREKFNWVLREIYEKMEIEIDEKMKQKLKYFYRRFCKYCDTLPVISFNGQRYDIPLIRQYLPLALQKLDSLPNFVIKKTRSYTAIGTERLKYLDLTNYLAAGTSLAKFYAAYKVKSPKGSFPYEHFQSISQLKETSLPKRSPELRDAMERNDQEKISKLSKFDPFYSTLKLKTISNEELDECEREWKEQDMRNLGDFIEYYNNLDVIGLVEAIEKMMLIYWDQGLNMFKDAISLPKLTQKQIFGPLKEDYFTSFSEKHQHIYKELREGIVGGPSVVYTRWAEKGRRIKGKELCKKVDGYDCNSLYLWATGLPQCTGPYCLREKSANFKKHTKHKDPSYLRYSQKAINWLNSIEKERGIKIRSAESHIHGEKRIENSYVDGYCDGTIFEFLGCYFHGHDCDPKNRLEEWDATHERLQKFRDMGYKVEYILECQWNRKAIPTPEPIPTTRKDIENGIIEDEIFGIVKCSLHVPSELTEFYSEFPPLFKNTEIKLEDIGPHMQEYAKTIGRQTGVKKSLISSMKGDGMVMLTTLFQKYIQMGLVCTDIQWVLEYNPKPVFQWFVDKVADDRRRADLNPDMAIIGETSKTSGNACYGYCCIDKGKHNSVIFCEQKDLSRHVRDPFFKSLEELDGGIFEIVKGKRSVIQDTAIQVAIGVYSMAKYSLIEFWEFLHDHLDQDLYSLMECDTDSLYIALARESIDDCVRPEKSEEWYRRKYDYFASDSNEPVTFDGQTITKKQYEKRTPGKYKLEFSGDGMICLNSKVYTIWGMKDGEKVSKTSSKGMQARNNLMREEFLDVLLNKSDHQVQNAGFIDDGLQKKTYEQTKKGLNYFYCKRIVLEDGIHTTHLSI